MYPYVSYSVQYFVFVSYRSGDDRPVKCIDDLVAHCTVAALLACVALVRSLIVICFSSCPLQRQLQLVFANAVVLNTTRALMLNNTRALITL